MSRQPSLNLVLKLVAGDAADAARQQQALLGDYLDHVRAPLVGIVPYAERESLCLEVEAHVAALADEYGFQGQTPLAAMQAALADFGEPWPIGQAFLQEWLQGSPVVAPARLTRAAAFRAFAFFGVAALPSWALLEHLALDTSASDLTPWFWLLAALSPPPAGALLGWGLPARMGRGLCWAVGALVLHALLTSALLLPDTTGFGFALCLLLWWLPAGWLSATAAARLARSHRRQRFLKYVR